MGHTLDGVAEPVGEVVHRVDAPVIAGPLVAVMPDSVDHRVPHVDIGRCHVDPGAQDPFAVAVFPGTHPLELGQVLLDAVVPVGAVAAGLRQGSPVFPDLVGGQAVHVRKALSDELEREFVQLLKVV